MGIVGEKFYGRQKESKLFNFTGQKAISYAISVVVIGVGLVTMAVNGAGEGKSLNYSLDFTGGTSMTATLGEYIDVTGDQGKTLRAIIKKQADQ